MRRTSVLALLLIAIGAARIASTFSATAEEATHIGAGLELMEFHRYEPQVANPPLPSRGRSDIANFSQGGEKRYKWDGTNKKKPDEPRQLRHRL